MDDELLSDLIVSSITITRSLTEEGGLVDRVWAEDGDGDELGLAEALGMLRLAEHTLLTAADVEDDGE